MDHQPKSNYLFEILNKLREREKQGNMRAQLFDKTFSSTTQHSQQLQSRGATTCSHEQEEAGSASQSPHVPIQQHSQRPTTPIRAHITMPNDDTGASAFQNEQTPRLREPEDMEWSPTEHISLSPRTRRRGKSSPTQPRGLRKLAPSPPENVSTEASITAGQAHSCRGDTRINARSAIPSAPPHANQANTTTAAIQLQEIMGSSRRFAPVYRTPRRPVKRRTGAHAQMSAPKRRATAGLQECSKEDQIQALRDVLSVLEDEYAEKERMSQNKEWCEPISHEMKVSTVMDFYKAFHDPNTLPTHTCTLCYRKYSPAELQALPWVEWELSSIDKNGPFSCSECFDKDQDILVCQDCLCHFQCSSLSRYGYLHQMLSCEHKFPDELKGLTPLEEQLIALNLQHSNLININIEHTESTKGDYTRHVKGHVTVFPNNVQDLATKVLPHPLVKVLDEVLVTWQGKEKPLPRDLSKLLSVRRRVVERALRWLIEFNPLYRDIQIDGEELDTWESLPHSVPSQLYQNAQRQEPSAWEKTRTAHIIPHQDRDIEDEGPNMDQVMEQLEVGVVPEAEDDTFEHQSRAEFELNGNGSYIDEITTSGMFMLNGSPETTDLERLEFAVNAVSSAGASTGAATSHQANGGTMEINQGENEQPYVHITRSDELANSSNPYFFAKTFPTLMPFGTGGPRSANETWSETESGNLAQNNNNSEVNRPAENSKTTRNMNLRMWAEAVLRRHGSRFSSHYAFAFLVFNMEVRHRNRGVSLLSIKRSSFPEVERTIRNLTAEKIQAASAELEQNGRTKDPEVSRLLKSLSIYGYQQPMSKEARLNMRKKIKSLIIRHGVPAIWFTLSPNDTASPIKLRLAAYRKNDPGIAEAVFQKLDSGYKRLKLAVSDPFSSAEFFHREVSMFFEHYVRIGERSIYGQINEYFGAIETNGRGSLHIHGLLWLQGNVDFLPSLVESCNPDAGEDASVYQERVVQYVDSVFTEVLDKESFYEIHRQRDSAYSTISNLMQNKESLCEAFEREANYCAGAVQVHTHGFSCAKYSAGKPKRKSESEPDMCRFGAPWALVDATSFTQDGVLKIRRNDKMVNRYNTAMALGLRHNHDISFIGTKCKTMSLIYYITNYATKVEDTNAKRAAAIADVFPRLEHLLREERENNYDNSGEEQPEVIRAKQSREFLLKMANRIFTEQPLSHVEVIAYLLGYRSDYSSTTQWSFLNMNFLYGVICRQWKHLQDTGGMDTTEYHHSDSSMMFSQQGQKLSIIDAYMHRGEVLKDLCLYDYASMVELQRRRIYRGNRIWIPFTEEWIPGHDWVQVLRLPGKHNTVCFDGFLDMEFDRDNEDDEEYYKRAAVQHLALFIPWEDFLKITCGDIDQIWKELKNSLPKRLLFIINNIQDLKRSAQDARRDAQQWASFGGISAQSTLEKGWLDEDDEDADEMHGTLYRSDHIGYLNRLINCFQAATATDEITAGSSNILDIVQKLNLFYEETIASQGPEEFDAALEVGRNRTFIPIQNIPPEDQLKAIKAQQKKQSGNIERKIRGFEEGSNNTTEHITNRRAVINSVFNGFGEESIQLRREDERDDISIQQTQNTTMEVLSGPSTTFLYIGKQLAESYTLKKRQRIALLLICRHLDAVERDQRRLDVGGNSGGHDDPDFESTSQQTFQQLFEYLGGEGGTGKSRVIEALVAVFAQKDMSHRILVTATSGTAAARINGVTIHSACRLGGQKRGKDDELTLRHINAPEQANWREKWLLIIDEVSMLGSKTLHDIDQELRHVRGQKADFGGIPTVLFAGDFHQFRPVQERSILQHPSEIPWELDTSYQKERKRLHEYAYGIWSKFTTVIILDEQVRAAGDLELMRLLTRVRLGLQDQSDLDLLNRRCFCEGKPIPWETGIKVITPLNRNRWNLNIEGTLAFQRNNQQILRIFLSTHRWMERPPTEDEEALILVVGDDSGIPVPPVFMFVPGMPVVINKNTHQGLKLVNGAVYTALEIIPDTRRFPGYHIAPNIVVHFGPPAGIILQNQSTEGFRFVGMPPGTILLTPMTTRINCLKKRTWQKQAASRKGLACVPAFACTDYKVQGETLEKVALELRGTFTRIVNGISEPSPCDPYGLYVQLSRCKTLDGILLLSKIREVDMIGNTIPLHMVMAEARLEQMCEKTIKEAEQAMLI